MQPLGFQESLITWFNVVSQQWHSCIQHGFHPNMTASNQWEQKNIRRPSNGLSMKLVGCQVDGVYHEASPFGWVFTPPLLGFGAMNEFRFFLNIWIWCLEIRDSSNPPKISEKYQTNTNLIGKKPWPQILWDTNISHLRSATKKHDDELSFSHCSRSASFKDGLKKQLSRSSWLEDESWDTLGTLDLHGSTSNMPGCQRKV